MVSAQPKSVGALLINVQVKWYAGFLQGCGKLQAFLDFHRLVFPSVPDEAGRRVLRHLKLIREEFDQLRIGIVAEQIVFRAYVRIRPHANHRITENSQIRPAALAFYWIGCVHSAGIEVSEQRLRKRGALRRRGAHPTPTTSSS